MRDERRKVREPEGSERRDSKRSSSVRDLNLVRLARNGDLDSMKQMIKDGADVNEQDECGWTALHEACMRNLPRMTEYLLRHGADPGMVNAKGDTALHCAARIGCLRIVRALLYYNANPLLLNHKGDKPLDLCQDAEVSNFLNQHIETNQIHMVSSSGSGKPAVLKVTRQHSTTSRSGKHLTSTSGTTVSDAIEYHGGGKDNNSMTSVSDVYSDSDGNDDNGDDDCHSTSTLSMSTSLAHQNIISPASNNQSDMNNLSSSGQHSHQTSSPSLSSVPKCIPDMYISSTKSLKKDPYAFEDDESDGTVNNPGNSLLLHPSPTNNTLTGHTGIHSSCGGGGGVGTASLTKTNTSPSSGLLSKHTHQLSSSNLPIVESVNIISDSNQSHSTTGT
ncbi:unnamed protein product [Heterobilharzia americana]|nr:unnamed protein product [Heterobilharzia americana]